MITFIIGKSIAKNKRNLGVNQGTFHFIRRSYRQWHSLFGNKTRERGKETILKHPELFLTC